MSLLRRSTICAILLVICAPTMGCAADQQSRREIEPAQAAPPPRYQKKTGVPILMDIPVLGVLFSRTTTVR